MLIFEDNDVLTLFGSLKHFPKLRNVKVELSLVSKFIFLKGNLTRSKGRRWCYEAFTLF
jgi:hypothetical protein